MVVFFACCCLTQFCYMKYFGSWLTPYAVNFIFLEFSDILLEAKSIWRDYVFLVVLVGLPYFLLLFLWKRGIIRQFSFRYYPLLYILFFGYFFYQASTPEGIFQMLFKNTCCTAYNTINSFSAFFANVLPKLDWQGRNFIIIHQRNIHSPYRRNYDGAEEIYGFRGAADQRTNDYDNAVLFEDVLLDKIMRHAEASGIMTYFYYVSDHGEALGQNGLWGHGHLDPADLRVPFLFTTFNGEDAAYQKKMTGLEDPCAWQIAVLVAKNSVLRYRFRGRTDGFVLSTAGIPWDGREC